MSISETSISVNEGEAFTVTGIGNCALRFAWASLDGDVETLIPSAGNTLTTLVGRVTGDSTYNYRFKAEYDTGWASIDMEVSVIENIADPMFTFDPPDTVWDGYQDVAITATITNIDAINASPAPYNVLKYAWTTSGITISKTGTTSQTMILTRAYGSGTFEVRLCVSNGGPLVCDTAVVTVLLPVGIKELQKALNPIQIQNGLLTWNRHASINIWDLDGSLLFSETGRQGKSVRLQQNIINGFQNRRYYVRITDLDMKPDK